MSTHEHILRLFDDNAAALTAARDVLPARLQQAAEMMIACYQHDGGVYLFGNGGSAADAQHIAAELVGRYQRERRALRAVALTTDASILTAVSNDYAYDRVFVRQLEALARPGDVAIGLSTSGNSPGVTAGLEYARAHDIRTIAVTGPGGGACAALADVLLPIPGDCTARVQEIGTLAYHILCELVEDALAN
jgi:D-sedoheptulose 7-phosphate isomerase